MQQKYIYLLVGVALGVYVMPRLPFRLPGA